MRLDELPFSQACENNKEPILTVLLSAFANAQQVLEVGSGTGQHAVYFARNLPHLIWQASDRKENLPAISRRIKLEGKPGEPEPLEFDAMLSPPADQFDALYTANTMHIMPTEAIRAFFKHLQENLKAAETLCIYGPFNQNGEYTSASNQRFDETLREQNKHMGIRDLEWITELAQASGFTLKENHVMPANNQLLEFIR